MLHLYSQKICEKRDKENIYNLFESWITQQKHILKRVGTNYFQDGKHE